MKRIRPVFTCGECETEIANTAFYVATRKGTAFLCNTCHGKIGSGCDQQGTLTIRHAVCSDRDRRGYETPNMPMTCLTRKQAKKYLPALSGKI